LKIDKKRHKTQFYFIKIKFYNLCCKQQFKVYKNILKKVLTYYFLDSIIALVS